MSKLLMMAAGLASVCSGNMQLLGAYPDLGILSDLASDPYTPEVPVNMTTLPKLKESAPCSTESFGRNGRCGFESNGFARCEQGLWCSQYGYCGSDEAYQVNSTCPREERPNPSVYQYVDDESSLNSTAIAAGAALEASYNPQQLRLSASKCQVDDAKARLAAVKPLCSSSRFSTNGRCGDVDTGFARCEQGFYCSQFGYCGSDPAYKVNPKCPMETRPNPEQYLYEFYTAVVEDAEILRNASNTTKPNCFVEAFHRHGKCGRQEHGYLRCEKGLWCSQHGYCGKGPEYQVNAICPEEKRPNPAVYTYGESPQ